MAYTIAQAGSTLKLIDESGVATSLTLPTGITLQTDRPARFARFGRYITLVNTPNRPLSIDELGKVRVLVPFAPGTEHTITGANAGNLTGSYRSKQTFLILDTLGNVIAESDFGPAQATAVSVTSKTLTLSNLNISPDDINASRIYRTVNGGSVYFLWRTLDGNTQTTVEDEDLADLALSIFAAPTLGTPPDLYLCTEWRGRLWGVGRTAIDDLRYTEAGTMYAWPTSNTATIPKPGTDSRGVTALIARREMLVVGRRDLIKGITGTNNRDFRVVDVSDQTGIESNESVAVWKEDVFFLGKQGVYKLGASGVECISDGKTRSWFTTDDYFNRARFQNTFGYIDPVRLKYRLHLAAVGSSTEDRWIEYDLTDGTWWGPHKTDDFTPTCGVAVSDSGDKMIPMIGSSGGYLAKEQSTATDTVEGSHGIAFDVITPYDPQGSALSEKFWGGLHVAGKAQTAGTVQITPYVGTFAAAAKLAMNYVMSDGLQKVCKALGVGALLKLRFQHSTAGEPVELYGYEIDDVHELGQR
jgi:hypothetical protein